jgi:hypothetical protein
MTEPCKKGDTGAAASRLKEINKGVTLLSCDNLCFILPK